jgi:hypothetical protein
VYFFWDKNRSYSGTLENHIPSVLNYLTTEPVEDYYRFTLYAFDETKSVYHFKVKQKKKDLALFFIWAYFSSSLKNKREYKRIRAIFNMIGIVELDVGCCLHQSIIGFLPPIIEKSLLTSII